MAVTLASVVTGERGRPACGQGQGGRRDATAAGLGAGSAKGSAVRCLRILAQVTRGMW